MSLPPMHALACVTTALDNTPTADQTCPGRAALGRAALGRATPGRATPGRTHQDQDSPDSSFRFSAQMSGPNRTFIQLHDQKSRAIAGHLNLVRRGKGVFAIYDLWVNPSFRGRFLSRSLMARAARSARLSGGQRLWLEAQPGGDMPPPVLYRLYERMGFRSSGVHPQTGRRVMERRL